MHEHGTGLIHTLGAPIFWIAVVMCIIAELAILRSAFTPPRDAGASLPIPHSPRGAEMIWAVIPAIALIVVLAATWRALN